MGFNYTIFDTHKFDQNVFDGFDTPASPMVDDTTDTNVEDSWQVRMFGLRTNPLKGKLFKC